MARIPEDVIERLKRQVSLERLLESQSVALKRHGADLIGLCPLHDDKSPSLVVSPKKNLWHCLGACQRGGTVIDWVMASENVSFRHAVDTLLRHESVSLPSASAVPKPAPAPLTAMASAEDREILAEVVGYYHETLKQSPEGLGYLDEERGLVSPEMIERFKLGFANRTLGYHLPGPKARERLQRLGLLRESGHEHFNGSLIVPIFGESGEVLGMYGRKVTPAYKLRKGTPLHLYLPGPHRGVFNLEAFSDKTVILCEALIDALTFWCAGFRNVTASYGTSGFIEDHLAAMKRYGTERVLIAYDRDDAGEAAAGSLAEKLMAHGVECWRVQFPRGMDANEYASKVKPADKSLGVVVRNAVWLGKGSRPAVELVGLPAPAATESAAEERVEVADAPALVASGAVLDQDFVTAAPEPVVEEPVAPSTPEATRPSLAAKEELPPPMTMSPRATDEGTNPDETTLTFGDRRYRVRGLTKNLSFGQLRVNLLVSRGEGLHVDTLDMYSSRQRAAFVRAAASELSAHEDTITRDIKAVLLRLEEIQDERIKGALQPKAKDVPLSEEDAERAMGLLRDGRLLARIVEDARACGIVGEETNLLLGYLAAVSRLLDEPLAIIVQSSSAAGKTALMEAILSFFPEEERIKYSAMTGQSLFYMGATDLKHKILAIVEEQGVERAAYALKLLQSEGELTIASTGKDPASGRLVTHEYRVEGPVMIFLTTTAVEIDEELLNRCLILTVDEDREQTRAIHKLQRERQTLEGLLARQSRPHLLKAHQDAQRLLKPLLVANPYARHLTFTDDRTRTRRDHVKYLTLIRSIALLHQFQREVKTAAHAGGHVSYIEVTLDDIAVANRMAHQVLGRSLDELSPQTRRLLMALEVMVTGACAGQGLERSECRFSRKDVRAATGWTDFQVRTHLDKLTSLEFVLVHHGGRGQSYVYELVYDGQGKDGQPFLAGLIDVEALQGVRAAGYDGNNEDGNGHFEGGSSPHRAPIEPTSRVGRDPLSLVPVAAESTSAAKENENAHLEPATKTPSRPAFPRNGATALRSAR